MSIDVEAVRRATPGCKRRLHFNNAGASLMPTPVVDAVIGHLEQEARIGGYEAAGEVRVDVEALYASAAQLVNCEPDEIAMLENATRAWNAVFYSIPFTSGDRIVTGRAEYCSNYMAYLHVTRATGAEIVVIDDDQYGQFDVDMLLNTVDDRVKLITLTHVPTSGGLVNPVAEVGEVARSAGVPFLLDACQSVGQMPIDVQEIGCDFLSTTGRKFLRAPRGTGFLYVSRRFLDVLHPPVVEVGSAEWTGIDRYTLREGAQRFETWEVSYALRLGLGRAIDYALELGLEHIWARVERLGRLLRNQLAETAGVTVHDLGARKCGIVTFSLSGYSADEVRQKLTSQGVNVDVSRTEDTRLDLEARRIQSMVRASVHYFNTEHEVDTFCQLIAEMPRRQLSAGGAS